MNLTGQSQFDQSRIEWAVRLRYSPFPELNMEMLASQLNSFRIGNIWLAGRTWEVMMERDTELVANANKRFEDVSSLEWEIMSDGSPEGDRHAASLKYFYDHCTATSALEQDEIGDVSLLIHQIATAIANRYSVHEMLLRVDNAAAKEVTAEFRHTPIWFFEARRGYLGFLPNIFDVYGQPLKHGEWLPAVGYGYMRACSIAYAMKHFPLRDWMLYCARFGFPAIQALTDATKDTQEWNDLNAALQSLANDWVTITNRGVEIKFLESANKGNLPFPELVDRADRAYAKLFRGSDLATGTRQAALGGNQVGASVQGGEKDILLQRDARWITPILNFRVDRPIIRYLYNAEPRAWIKILGPGDDDVQTDLATAGFLVQNNVPIAVSTARERFNWPEPEPGEPVLQPAASAKSVPGNGKPTDQPGKKLGEEPGKKDETIAEGADANRQPQEPDPNMPGGRRANADNYPAGAEKALDNATAAPNVDPAFEKAATHEVVQALREDFSHLNDQLAAILQINDPALLQRKLENFFAKLDSFEQDMQRDPALATALRKILATQFAQGLADKGETAS